MDDPWDVKSIRHSEHYISCMKLNGVPLLPPVLSKECRKEMQYYRLLAKEVEKRIECLKPLITDRSLVEENENTIELNKLDSPITLTDTTDVDMKVKISMTPRNLMESSVSKIPPSNIAKQAVLGSTVPSNGSSRLIIDVNLNMGDQDNQELKASTPIKPQSALPIEIPEHDYDCEKIIECESADHSRITRSTKRGSNKQLKRFKVRKHDCFTDLPCFQEAPSSLTAKSFTGSLNNLHSDLNDINSEPKLLRQSSYTVLTPSPQLLAHLQIQSLNTGVEMTSISMSESMSNLSSPNKKRRSWDLESAKVKWSSMALELKQRNSKKICTNNSAISSTSNINQKSISKTPRTKSPGVTKSLYEDKVRPASLNRTQTSESINKFKRGPSPSKFKNKISKENMNTEQAYKQKPKESIKKVIPDEVGKSTNSTLSEDPATKIRDLYEKVQKQQLVQMATLVEKQKREQLLLQQVFEEQNKLLFKQLKTICPKPQNEVKPAWEGKDSMDRGPVSLKQLMSDKPSDLSIESQLSSCTLIDTNKYIVHCEKILKKSKDLSNSIKKGETGNGEKISGGSRTRTNSPVNRRNTPTSRKLNYDSSLSSDKEHETVLTDRTNDTFADLNVTFPSDHSDELQHNDTVIKNVDPCSIASIDTAIMSMEEKILKSINDMGPRHSSFTLRKTPSQLEITAACYSLHDTFITSTAGERCAMIATDRNRRNLAALRPSPRQQRPTDPMSQSHSGVFLQRARTPAHSSMTQSNYETFSTTSKRSGGRYIPAPNRRPWR